MPFNLFHKKKEPQQQTPAVAPQIESQPETQAEPIQEAAAEPQAADQPEQQTPTEPQAAEETPAQPATEEPQTQATAELEPEQPKPEAASKTYLKAMPLKDLSDVANVKEEVNNGNIIILRVTPLAGKSIEDVKTAVNELFQFAEASGGDIARLGEERVVICPKTVRIWREKTPAPVASNQPLPTAA